MRIAYAGARGRAMEMRLTTSVGLYERGNGVPKDSARAIVLYSMVASDAESYGGSRLRMRELAPLLSKRKWRKRGAGSRSGWPRTSSLGAESSPPPSARG